ncbi:MAG: response regulator transcription factor [Acidimicrobiia bacterium]
MINRTAPVDLLTILVVNGDAQIRGLLVDALRREGIGAEEASDGEIALDAVAHHPPDLVILDVDLPRLDGLQVLASLKRTSDTPVILTGRDQATDRILGLDLGADDYVGKPFSPAEVVARVRAVLRRRTPPPAPPHLDFRDLVIDLDRRAVSVEGRPIHLTRREFDLLAFLASSPRRVFSREQILTLVWGSSSEWQSPTTVTEHVRRLRHHIEAEPDQPRHLISVRGVGYRFEP